MNTISLKPFNKHSGTRTRWVPRIASDMRAQYARLEKTLRLEAHAREQGSQNLPLATDTALDQTQRHVVAYIQGGADVLKQFLDGALNEALSKLRLRAPAPLDLETAVARAQAEAASVRLEAESPLVEARVEERRSFRNLRLFRAQHRQFREAEYARDQYKVWAMLSALVFAEALGNALLFMEVVRGGIAGALLLAVLLAVLNVGVGMLAGVWGIRPLRHVSVGIKAAGAVALLATVTLGVYWNLAMAHNRELMSLTTDMEAGFDWSLRPSTAWLDVTTPQTLMLLGLGLLCFIGAMIKGAGGPSSMVDPYVGYATKDRAYRIKLGAWEAGKAAYKGAVMDAYDNALAELRGRHERDAAAVEEIREIAAEAEERAAEGRDSTGEWIEMGGISIRRYREENRAVRTSDAPAYFDHYPTFEEVAVGLRDAAAVADAAERAAAVHEANGRALAAVAMQVVVLRERQIAAFDAEIARIESEAEKRVEEAALAEAAP